MLGPQATGKVKRQNPTFCYACSCLPPALSMPMAGDMITGFYQVSKSGKRVAASPCFYENDKSRFDDVMVASFKLNSRTVYQGCNVTVWSAILLVFIRPYREANIAGDFEQIDQDSKEFQAY